MAASFVGADRVPWFLMGIDWSWFWDRRGGVDGDGVPGDGRWFALSDFALIGEGLEGLSAVRGPWGVVEALDKHLQGTEHALGDVVEVFAVFAPELEVAGVAASVGEDGEWDEAVIEGESCDGDGGGVGC